MAIWPKNLTKEMPVKRILEFAVGYALGRALFKVIGMLAVFALYLINALGTN